MHARQFSNDPEARTSYRTIGRARLTEVFERPPVPHQTVCGKIFWPVFCRKEINIVYGGQRTLLERAFPVWQLLPDIGVRLPSHSKQITTFRYYVILLSIFHATSNAVFTLFKTFTNATNNLLEDAPLVPCTVYLFACSTRLNVGDSGVFCCVPCYFRDV